MATSVPPPAPNPMRMRIGLSAGHSACAGAATASMMPAAMVAEMIARFMIVLPFCWSMIFSQTGCHPGIKSEGKLFGIML